MRSAIGVFAAASVVLALSACAPPIGVASPSSTPRAEVTATPTPAQASAPSVRIPVPCTSLFTAASSSALVGSAVTPQIDETTTPVDVVGIAARQYGTLVCLWGGTGRTDGGYDANLTVEISPDAAAGYAANVGKGGAGSAPTATNTAGDQSQYTCQVQGEFQCNADMLVGTFWVSASLQDIANSSVSKSTASSRMQQVLARVAKDLGAAATLAAWTPPAGSLPGFCSGNSSTALVNTALGVTDFGLTGDDDGDATAESFAQRPGVYTQCTWGSGSSSGDFTYLQVAMINGGSWALPALAGQRDAQAYTLGPYEPTTVAGATSAMSSCNEGANQCQYFLTIGSLLVFVGLDDPGTSKVNAALAQVVADISAS